MKIPFDIKFRPQIESGEYKVFAHEHEGQEARIVCWDNKGEYPIVALVDNEPEKYDIHGRVPGGNRGGEFSLFIVTPEEEMTEDESITAEIVDFIQRNAERGDDIMKSAGWVAYLERQKEQKSIEDVIKNITKNKEAATKFLKSAGIMDDNGELAEMYRSEQKPAELSEGNEGLIDLAVAAVEDFYDEKNPIRIEIINFLKSLRHQPKQEWSEKDEAVLDALIRRLEGEDIYVSPHLAVECLKSIRSRPR